MINSQDIIFVNFHVFLFVNNIFDNVCMTQMSLIERGLQVGEEWGCATMRFLMMIEVVLASLRTTKGNRFDRGHAHIWHHHMCSFFNHFLVFFILSLYFIKQSLLF